MDLLDTHLHLIDRRRLAYDWLASVPALDRDWPLADYARQAARLGIIGALHMEVDVAPRDIDAETAMVAGLARQPASLLRGAIAACRPEAPDFATWLERLDRATVRGLRRVLHVVPDDMSQSAAFRAGIRRLGPAGLPFDICMQARQLPLAMALIDAAPDTMFILDHCGNPEIAGAGLPPWRMAMEEVALRPNVAVKISGLFAQTGPEWTLDSLRPYVETAIRAFGWDRVVWGSDSPVLTLGGSLAEWVAVTRAVMAGASADERAALGHRNARRIWGLGPDPAPAPG